MICEKCKSKMNWNIQDSTQGWWCPACGWNILTTYFDEISLDMTEYSLYIKTVLEIDKEKIKLISQIANVNYIAAKHMLEEKEVCILKAAAPEIRKAAIKLQELEIDFSISPLFKYL